MKGLYIFGDIACCWYIKNNPSSRIEVLEGATPLKILFTKLMFHPKTT